MDYLKELWDLYENDLTQRMGAAVDKAKTGGTDLGGGVVKNNQIQRKPQPKPVLRDPVDSTPTKIQTPINPEINLRNQQTKDINVARQQGVAPGDAYERIKGQVNTGDPSSVGDFAATLSMTQMDRSQAPKIEPGSQSVLAKDVDKNQNETLPDDGDLKRPSNMEISDEDEQENLEAGERERLETSPEAVDNAQAQLDQMTPEQKLDDDIENIKSTLGTQEDTPESQEYKAQQTQPEITPVQQAREDERKQTLIDTLNRIMETPEKKKGAGANKLTRQDAELLKAYIEGNGPQIERMEITDEDMAFAKDYLKKNFKQAFTKLKLGTKGAPKEGYKGRADAVLKSYLANKGLSAVTGEALPYSASELDHITSLGNGGVDGFENWAWVDKRYNQFMSAHDDQGVLAKIDKLMSQNPDDERLKELKAELSNETRSRYTSYFKKKGYSNVTIEDIQGAKGEAGNQMLKALASVAGVNTYKGSDDRTRARGRFIGYPELKKELIAKINPITQDQQEEFDEALMEIKQFIEDKQTEMEPFTKRGRKKRKTVKEAYLEWLLETKFGYKLITEDYDEEELDTENEDDYNDDVDFLRKYGRA